MKRSLVVSFALGILCLWAVGLVAAENAAVTGDGVRIREAPGTSGKILTSVNKGTRVEVTAKASLTETVDGHLDSWYAVLYQGKKGYIFGRFLAFDAGVVVPDEGMPMPKAPTPANVTVRPEDIIGDWAHYDTLPPVIYTFEPGGYAQYLALVWDVDLAGEKVGRKYLTVDLVRGYYTIDGSTVRVNWYWGDKPDNVFTVQKDRDGVTLAVDGKKIPARFHTGRPGATPVGDIVINTEPDL